MVAVTSDGNGVEVGQIGFEGISGYPVLLVSTARPIEP